MKKMLPNPSIATLIKQGHEQLDKGDYADALKTFQQAAAEESQNHEVLYGLGLACYRLERYEEAVEYFNQALEVKQNYILALVRRGLAHGELKKTQQAEADFGQAIALTPEDAEDWRGRGIALDELGRYEDAIASYDKAIEVKPDDYQVWGNRGTALFYLGRYEEAIASYDKAIEIKHDDYSAWYRRGVALSNLKRYEDAIADFDKAIEIKPDDYSAWGIRGSVLFGLGRYEDAIADFDKAIEIKPDECDAWYSRGVALNHLEKYEDAIADFDKAIEIKPDDYSAWFSRGVALNHLEKYEDEVASLNKAIEIKPDEYDAWYKRGLALFNLEKYEDTVTSWNKAIEIKPDEYIAWVQRGIVLCYIFRQYNDAITSLNKAIEIKHDDYSAWYSRGVALNHLEKYEDAIADFDKAIEIKPDEYDAWYSRGVALNHLEKYEDAIADFDKAIEIKPDEYDAWYSRGEALNHLEKYEDAVASLDKAIEIKPDEYIAWHNRGIVLGKLRRYEDAVASYDKAIEIKPNDYNTWYEQGIALRNLEKYEDAVASLNKAIEIKPNDYNTWYEQGIALRNLEKYEDAVASLNKAIEIKPDDYNTWNSLGAVLCDNLCRYKEAITSFNEALRLTENQYWLAWNNKGMALLKSQGYKAAIETWDNGIKALKPDNPNYEENCGKLHHQKGEIFYEYATKKSEPFTNWFAAKTSYEKALNFLTFDKFPNRHLQVLQKILQVCSALGDDKTFQRRIEQGTKRLEELLAKCETKGQKITLERKYAAFNQLRVDIKLQSKDVDKEITALELAEKRKNTCLAWLQEKWDYQPPNLTYQDMQRLLNPKTAAIFWHISPNAITTFIIKPNQQPIVVSPQRFFGNSPQSEIKAYFEQLQSFQDWIKEWKQDYQDYCQKKYPDKIKQTSPWRQKIKELLNNLGDILEINRIKKQLEGIEQLILIPHRELHLLPLDYLFPKYFNITYLPSFQIGLKLLIQPSILAKPISNLLNVTTNDLIFNSIESTALATLYPTYNQLEIPPITQKILTTALQKNSGYFHFAGHGYHLPDNPRQSALLLTESDKLTLGDIVDNEQLDLNKYELICLSACETGITSNYNLVDEYVGLVSGFLAKGATYVLNTLWTVDERSTALLMIQFYQLMKEGETPIVALKKAKQWLRELSYQELAKWYSDLGDKLDEPHCIEFIKTEVSMIENDGNKITLNETIYDDPYYWAGFILTGKPE